MNLRRIIKRYGAEYTVTRPGVKTTTKGRTSRGAATTYQATLYVEPATTDTLEGLDRGLQVLRELGRTHEIKAAYTTTAIAVRDSFDYEGRTFHVMLVNRFDQLSGGPHFVAVAAAEVAT